MEYLRVDERELTPETGDTAKCPDSAKPGKRPEPAMTPGVTVNEVAP